jgi:hypothetical protein
VRNADEPIGKAKGENHFGRSGEKRYKAQFSHFIKYRVSDRAQVFHRAESTTSPWNSYVKDALERKLHKLVCAGQLDFKTAQREIPSDWIEAYEKYVGKSPPAPRVRETKTAPATTTNEVWVNTRSGKYCGNRVLGFTVKPSRASSCRSWKPLIADIPRQVEQANRLMPRKPKTYESYRRPNSEGRNGRASQRFGSVR